MIYPINFMSKQYNNYNSMYTIRKQVIFFFLKKVLINLLYIKNLSILYYYYDFYLRFLLIFLINLFLDYSLTNSL